MEDEEHEAGDDEGDRTAGPSPLASQPSFLTVARVVRPHGTAGELACEIITEFPQRFRKTRTVYLAPGGSNGRGVQAPVAHTVRSARLSQRRGGAQLLLCVEGVDDRDAAEALRGALIQVPESEAWKLPRGRYYWHQIIGLRVVTREGRELGVIKEILETGANDVYIVETSRGELLVPAIKSVVKKIAPENGVVIVELLPGMEQ